MNRKKIIYSLFLITVFLVVVIPQTPLVHAGTPIFFNRKGGVCSNAGGSCTVVLQIAASSEIIIIEAIPGANGCTANQDPSPFITDTFANSFALKACVHQANGAGPMDQTIFMIGATTQSSQSGADTVTLKTTNNAGVSVDCNNGAGGGNGCAFDVLDYTSFTGFGASNTFVSTSASGTSAIAITTQPGSVILGAMMNQNVNPCQATQNGSATGTQSVLQTWNNTKINNTNCETGFDSTNNNFNGGTYTDNIAWTCGTCGAQAITQVILEVQGFATGNNLGTVTQCYGNCGNPPITLANTNSTHSINFNNSITLFYEFQSNLNGFLINESTPIAKTYSNGQQVSMAVYTATCNAGVTPFTASCPGQQRASIVGPSNPTKGRFNFVPNPISVFNGQWVAISISATFSGLDINDTNTAVSIFNQSPGQNPPLLNAGASFTTCSCKLGLWAFILGNTITAPPPISAATTNCGTDFLCSLTLGIQGLTPTNPPVGAFIIGLAWAIATIALLEWIMYKIGHGVVVLPAGLYILIFMGWITIMMFLVGALWFIFLEAITVILLFSGYLGSVVTGHGRGRQSE